MIDLTYTSYFIVLVVLYYLLLFGLATRYRRPSVEAPDLCFVVFVAALNEEEVISDTIKNLLALDFPRLTICLADDGSSDRTWELMNAFKDDPRTVLIRRVLPDARCGKSDVLNQCYKETIRLLTTDHGLLGGASESNIVVGIMDADGRLDGDSLRVVAPYFADPKVASVQIGVRIANASTNLLTRMQDMEFVGFSSYVQKARDRLGSSGLGGNGQFTRLSALQDLYSSRGGPWRTDALTEDLELGLALVTRGWITRFCPDTFVAQQGLPRWRALFRQRTRWIQGHYNCWRYVPRLLTTRKRLSIVTRLDLVAYLLLVATVAVIFFNLLIGFLASLGVVEIKNSFATLLGTGHILVAFNVVFGLLPLVFFMGVYQVHAIRPFRWWEIPAAGVAFTIYTYIWILATLRALYRLVTGRRDWVKTPRVLNSSATDVEAGS